MAADVKLAGIGQLQHGREAACNLPGSPRQAHCLEAKLCLLHHTSFKAACTEKGSQGPALSLSSF